MKHKLRRLENGVWHIWEHRSSLCNRGKDVQARLAKRTGTHSAELDQKELDEFADGKQLQGYPLCHVCLAICCPDKAYSPEKPRRQRLAYRGHRMSLTVRLKPEDHDLIRRLGGFDMVRHDALMELIPIVEQLELQPKSKRRPLKLMIPDQLKTAIQEVSAKTGHSFVEILLMAARKYSAAKC